MTDIQKTIERLKELEAKATPGLWNEKALERLLRFGEKNDGCWVEDLPMNENLPGRDDAALIVAMRNALSELLQKLHDCDKWKARAEALERFIRGRHRVICFGCQFWEKAQGGYWCGKDCYDYDRWQFDEAKFKEDKE